MFGLRSNMSNTGDRVLSRSLNTKKISENTTRSGVVLTIIEVFV